MKNKLKLTQNQVKEIFDYHEDGYLIWKKRIARVVYVGTRAGSFNTANGYYTVGIFGYTYKVHRIIFLWHKGYLPELVDHEDQDPTHNWIDNLREVSTQCNARNCRISKNNTSGVVGVGKDTHSIKWKSQIKVNRKNYNLGLFDNFDDAVMVRWKKEVELRWNGCNSTSSAYLYLKKKGLIPKKRFNILRKQFGQRSSIMF
jgi:hypothetical protein